MLKRIIEKFQAKNKKLKFSFKGHFLINQVYQFFFKLYCLHIVFYILLYIISYIKYKEKQISLKEIFYFKINTMNLKNI